MKMTGGYIKQLAMETGRILIGVQGVGRFRDRFVVIQIHPTNYQLRTGDLVWWESTCLRWENKRLPRYLKNLTPVPGNP